MSIKRNRFSVSAVLTIAGLALTGCSGGDSSTEDPPSESSTSSEANETNTTDDADDAGTTQNADDSDQDEEMAEHARFAVDTGLAVFFCEFVALKLNTRPRETLKWQTPAEARDEALLAATS